MQLTFVITFLHTRHACLGLFALLWLGAVPPSVASTLLRLTSVRLLDGDFLDAVGANRSYLLALEPDRLLAPFLREAGLTPKAPPYGNWESGGLDGHTAGHYLSALALMMASGHDDDGELERRLDDMLAELGRCQDAHGDGYLGGVPNSRAFWRRIRSGDVAVIGSKWVPWYNLHKTFAGLRDAYQLAGKDSARSLLAHLGDWCLSVTAGLSDGQMQRMLDNEHGGMNEVLADLYTITGEATYLATAERFSHRAVLDPLCREQDRLTGLHANTQIPKVIGLARLAALTGNPAYRSGAGYFWRTVTGRRTVAFGGNSVAEHFNDPDNFRGMIETREGPETCNTYNMLRLTEELFAHDPDASYADYYERALYNHILASIHPDQPGFVYFTPIRPGHYRVYSQPASCFWCCVGSGMENPGRYGAFIYAHDQDDMVVNLFIPSIAKFGPGRMLRQDTRFPDEPRTRLRLTLDRPAKFALRIRRPGWAVDGFEVSINGEPVNLVSKPGSYVSVQRTWRDGDTAEVELPMRTTVERLPDGSDWVAFLHGPIVLASPAGTQNQAGLRADDARMGHVAHGPLVSLDQAPVLVAEESDLPALVKPDVDGGPLHFRLVDGVEPAPPNAVSLQPFFRLHDQRYQMYWECTTREHLAARNVALAAEERTRALREASTLDRVAIGEQQPEVEHQLQGEDMETGVHEGRRWRHGAWVQYSLDPRGEATADLEVTYWGGDSGRTFDIQVNGRTIATQSLDGEHPGRFVTLRYPISKSVIQASDGGHVTVRFVATRWLAGGIYDVRLRRQSKTP